MDNRTAFLLAILLICGFVADTVFDWGAVGFLIQKVIDLVGYLAFWQ